MYDVFSSAYLKHSENLPFLQFVEPINRGQKLNISRSFDKAKKKQIKKSKKQSKKTKCLLSEIV